jgi:elongation factor G
VTAKPSCNSEGIDSEGHFQKVIARVPLAEMDGYSSSLRSITQGRAKFKSGFLEYAPVPFEIQRRLIDEHAKACEGRVCLISFFLHY